MQSRAKPVIFFSLSPPFSFSLQLCYILGGSYLTFTFHAATFILSKIHSSSNSFLVVPYSKSPRKSTSRFHSVFINIPPHNMSAQQPTQAAPAQAAAPPPAQAAAPPPPAGATTAAPTAAPVTDDRDYVDKGRKRWTFTKPQAGYR